MPNRSKSAEKAAIKRASKTAQQAVTDLDRKAIDELVQLYESTTGDIVDSIDKRASDDGTVDIGDLHELLQEISDHLDGLSGRRAEQLQQSLEQAAFLGTEPFKAALGAQLVGKMNFEAVQFVRQFQAADGLRLSDRIWRIDNQARETVQNAVQQAVVRGHGAAQAARNLLIHGEQVPLDVQLGIRAADAKAIGEKVGSSMLTGEGNPLYNAMRVFRTEINRAHGTAYQRAAEAHPDAIGTKFTLSPRHPRVDVCDMHARANLYGLGPGVYPHGKNPWPAHPNTLSFVMVMFKDEVTAADEAGRQTPQEFLESVPREQRQGILGKNKNEAFEAGDLSTGMLNSRWKDVRARLERQQGRQYSYKPVSP